MIIAFNLYYSLHALCLTFTRVSFFSFLSFQFALSTTIPLAIPSKRASPHQTLILFGLSIFLVFLFFAFFPFTLSALCPFLSRLLWLSILPRHRRVPPPTFLILLFVDSFKPLLNVTHVLKSREAHLPLHCISSINQSFSPPPHQSVELCIPFACLFSATAISSNQQFFTCVTVQSTSSQ